MSMSLLPTLNAILNGTSGLLIIAGFLFIRGKHIRAHRACMIAAVCCSVLFLISYLYYHYHHGATRFTGTGWVRPFYLTILVTHTILAALIVPFVIVTLVRGLRGQFAKHIRIARWTFPM